MWSTTKGLWNYFLFRLDPYHHLESKWRGPLAELLGKLAPQRAERVDKIRMGGRHDGGYVMLDDLSGIKGAYSLGIGPNVDWDMAIAERGVPVYQYDHTVSQSPMHHKLFTFQPWRIGTHHDPDAQVVSLPSLICLNHHEDTDLILKIDIDGAEWDVFAQIDPDQLKVFRQILVEFHALDCVVDTNWRNQALTALVHLSRHHQVVHVHGNNLARILVADDVRIPETLEVTFVRRDSYRLVPTAETFPGPFDRPNSWMFPDFPLGRFRFESHEREK